MVTVLSTADLKRKVKLTFRAWRSFVRLRFLFICSLPTFYISIFIKSTTNTNQIFQILKMQWYSQIILKVCVFSSILERRVPYPRIGFPPLKMNALPGNLINGPAITAYQQTHNQHGGNERNKNDKDDRNRNTCKQRQWRYFERFWNGRSYCWESSHNNGWLWGSRYAV